MARAAATWRRQGRPDARDRAAGDARAAWRRAVPLATLSACVALALGACASTAVLQGRGYHGNEYSLETRGTDPQQRTRQALREAEAFCASRGFAVVPGSAIHGIAKTTLTFQCAEERTIGSGAARPVPAHDQ